MKYLTEWPGSSGSRATSSGGCTSTRRRWASWIGLCAASRLVAAPPKPDVTPDGKTWRAMTLEWRVGYLVGYIDGATNGLTKPAGEELAAGKFTKEHLDQALAGSRSLIPISLNLIDMMDGIDSFYSEPANRNLLVATAMVILAMKAGGKSQKEIDVATRIAREQGMH